MTPESPRSQAIDQFRGLAIVLMVLANYLAGIGWIPAWLKHAPDIGLTVTDLVASLFIFAIGLTYGSSFRRRLLREGANKTYQHFIIRWAALIGIGALFSAGEIAVVGEPSVNWGVLQAIGVAGMVTLPFLRLPLLTAWGKNPLLLYLLHELFIGVFFLPGILAWYGPGHAAAGTGPDRGIAGWIELDCGGIGT